MTSAAPRRLILLVEDNPSDVEFAQEALEMAGADVDLIVATDGQEAVDLLHGSGPRPDIMLLDLNLPRMGGREVLEHVKGDPRLQSLPVIVLTTSAAPSDIEACYQRHANGYLNKPVSFIEFVELMKSFRTYWLESSRLPAA